MTTTPDTQRRDRLTALFARLIDGTEGCANPARLADAVIAADQAHADKEQQEMADGCVRFTAAVRAENDRLRKEAAEVRAAALTEAADAIDTETRLMKLAGVLEPNRFRPCRDASEQLRRMAAAARPDNTRGA